MSACCVLPGGSRSRCWLVRLCSQESRSGDLDHAPVAAVDERRPVRHRALLARRVAVMRRDALVRPERLDGTVDFKHGTESSSVLAGKILLH